MVSDDQGIRGFIERFASVLCDSGIPRMPSRVFAALLCSDSGRMTSAELADLLEISPAAVSGAVRYLNQVSLVTRERDPGSRRDRYRVLADGWHEAMLRRDQVLSRWEASMSEGIDLLGADSPAGARLNESLTFFGFLRREMPKLLERWHEERSTPHRPAAAD